MSILSKGYLTTEDLVKYIKERHNRHWGKCYISLLIKAKKIPVERLGRQNIFSAKEIDNYVARRKRKCSSGKYRVKCKN